MTTARLLTVLLVAGLWVRCVDLDDEVECVQDIDCGSGRACDAEGTCHEAQVRPLQEELFFECLDNNLIPASWRCNGTVDCCDEGDEADCDAIVPPANTWSCQLGYFASDDGCDCGCGERDPDCPQGATVDDCEFDYCDFEGLDPDDVTVCLGAGSETAEIPEGWTCVPSYYNAGDGCDCGCGEPDPDCESDAAAVCDYDTCSGGVDPDDATACLGVASGGCFSCANGDAISRAFKCDGYPDCRFGEDENECPGFFACESGLSIQPSWVCDGDADCPAGEDEANCPGPFVCDDGAEFPPDYRCDGAPDCVGEEDEADCDVDAGVDDAGLADGGAVDAGLPDAGPLDAGTAEAGPLDAGADDAGPIDAGTADAGTIDAGTSDAGASDAGVSDAGVGDAGVSDAGASDAGALDAGTNDAGTNDAGTNDAA